MKPVPFVPGAVAGVKAGAYGDGGGFVEGTPVEPAHERCALARTTLPAVAD